MTCVIPSPPALPVRIQRSAPSGEQGAGGAGRQVREALLSGGIDVSEPALRSRIPRVR